MNPSSTALVIFLAIVFLTENSSGKPTKYDQRQEGDLNVRTDVEDVVFVLVPPKDIVSAGMGLVAATAADFLKKNYGPVGLERWPLRTTSKIGFVPMENSPYKVDLEKSNVQVKKISQSGDPNRYNFHEEKNPSKSAIPTTTEVPVKSTTEVTVEKEEVSTTTEGKTVKKDLKTEEQKKEILDEKKGEKIKGGMEKKSEGTKMKSDSKKSTNADEPPEIIGGSSDPTSIFRYEGCGPDAYRDQNGVCVYKSPDSKPK